ncbi:sce7725 family protein [Pseudomonas guariconensis]|uniref:sce7725 family protein n=1 Tax=Pseudomonas guariconensis TaxID=1288410 RepID=UPI002D1F5CB7|nr:sce7725 family protein [Pseudomonas guariconensis]MEB3843078.1 sce7725 family protein [Pseudomonas guariconensis]MEB3875946.1 sce7725 family protein [Pseudomonas guariconensis]MEB3880773.1 sce7725 family protein [Pseudomonas guariconensis]MEB3897909.1 sce7725 family protein [Pseudomonas guariconensis]
MYHPYFRGKQFDLLAVRECAKIFADSKFTPIIEPVRESLSGLMRAIGELSEHEASAVLIANPRYGDHTEKTDALQELIEEDLKRHDNISIGILLTESINTWNAISLAEKYKNRKLVFIHADFQEAKDLSAAISTEQIEASHIFFESHCGKLYRRYFDSPDRVLLRDGFKRQANSKYPDTEPFSDLHVTFLEEGMSGFGDFLIVGDEYSEGGGPAYAVAIHLTYIDDAMDDTMYVHHFKSDRQNTPTDPAGKFYEAVTKLAAAVEAKDSKIYRSTAVEEFLKLHKSGHFPGLGYVKKLSMKHHIETLAEYFRG